MILTQIIMTIFVLFAVSRVVLRFRERKISFVAMISWFLLWIAVEIIIWRPDVTTSLAKILGIGRGADLLIYGSLLVIFYSVFRIYIKFEDLERQITTLVRKIALEKSKPKKKSL
jgi:hypothetical protein